MLAYTPGWVRLRSQRMLPRKWLGESSRGASLRSPTLVRVLSAILDSPAASHQALVKLLKSSSLGVLGRSLVGGFFLLNAQVRGLVPWVHVVDIFGGGGSGRRCPCVVVRIVFWPAWGWLASAVATTVFGVGLPDTPAVPSTSPEPVADRGQGLSSGCS
jgi:hypothetical protein